ncbi:unnamed protein product, partial [Rotaria magnacalcarata]
DYHDDTKYDNQIENAKDFNCDDDREDNDDEVVLEFIYDNNVSINFSVFLYLLVCLYCYLIIYHAAGFISLAKNYCLNDNEIQSNLMNVSVDIESSYCYQSAS